MKSLRMGAKRVMVVTDPRMAKLEPVAVVLDSLKAEGIDAVLFDQVEVEPTDESFKEAIEFASDGRFDAFVSVGGGSSMDTAKAANLYSTHPADFLTYVNAPIGQGEPVPGPLKPHIAVPTTSGTGSETTGVAIFDLLEMKAKTGLAHRALRPTMGIVDPENSRTLPGMVTACSGFDVLCHGLESYTALPFSHREAPPNPGLRPSYQGSNPISDVWATRAIEMVSGNMVSAVKDSEDIESRSNMMLAATFAGVGFGNAGCHLPHGMSYPVSGMVREYVPGGLSRRPSHRAARHERDSERARRVQVHRSDQPGEAPVRGAADGRGRVGRGAGGRGRHTGGRYRIAAQGDRRPERAERNRLLAGGRSRAGGGRDSPAAGHRAVTAPGGRRGFATVVPRFDDVVVIGV